ncbi:RING finger domain-containing protein [Atractiella rhizophila]|nr:RING finger domain-containing protein [Atractiella rhizophila]
MSEDGFFDDAMDDSEITEGDEGDYDDSMRGFEEDTDDGDSAFEAISTLDKGKQKSYQIDFSVLEKDQIVAAQEGEIAHVSGIAGIKPTEAAILLRHYGWNKEKVIERYLTDSDKTLLEAGIHTDSKRQPKLSVKQGFVCDVCYDDTTKESIALSCNHRYCKDCYSHYLEQKIAEEGESRRIQCMGSECSLIVDEKTIALLVSPPVLNKYRHLLNRTYVDDDPTLRWCPAPGCDHAIRCTIPLRSLTSIVPTVQCKCGKTFCFGCGRDDHQPCICAIVNLWLKKCEDDSETANWISANTKECTKCHSTIEKNGGCNHMTCKKCKWEFCWVCMGPWSEHGTSWYNCNRFEDKGEAKDAISKSRVALERYLHYYNRYSNHEQSAKLEKDVYARIEKKMEEIQQSSKLSWIEVQFMKRAVDTLGKCRATLKWTYAMAFYLKRTTQTELFEANQSDLEHAVEQLSELLEKPIEAENIPQLRQETTDKTVYVEKRNETMLSDTAGGFQEDRWEFSVPLEH